MLLVDAGNTRVAFAEYDGVSPGPVQAVPTAEFVLPADAGPVAAASVVPAVTAELRKADRDIFILANSHAAAAGLSLAEVDASTLGADRLANAIELVHEDLLPAVSIDFGTAVNCEIVDKNGIFRGGAIGPGRRLMYRSLAAGAAQLPDAFHADALRMEPGSNTAATIAFGVDQAVLGMVREWLARIQDLYGPVRIVGMGGDVELYRKFIPGMEFGGNDFTLRGLLHAYLSNRG
jgi:type III pantothenate kinase